MKTTCLKSENGSVLLATMIFVLAVAGFLSMYLWTIQNSDQQVARAQTWNATLPVAEAGIEEGLADVNFNIGTSLSNSIASLSPLSHSINGGTYHVNFYGGAAPYIISTGIMTAPITGAAISRAVKVVIQKQGLFTKGLVALDYINMNGNSIASSSWNSMDPLESSNGLFIGFSGTNGDIAAVYGYVSLGNQTIKGSLYLGPAATYDGSGTILGQIYYDANLNYPNVTLPTTDSSGNPIIWTPAPTINIGTVSSPVWEHDFTVPGNYTVSDSLPVVVEPGVNVTMDIQQVDWKPNLVNINGGTTNSGNAVLYIESGTITMGGNSSGGASANQPKNLFVFGLPDVTSVTFSGTSTFNGVVYAPEANMTLNGGGDSYDLIGAYVVNTLTMNGHYDFHYDTSLSLYYNSGYVVGSWQEL